IHRDPRMYRYQPHRVVWSGEIQHPEIGDHLMDIVETLCCGTGFTCTVVTDTGNHIDLLDEYSFAVFGHPVTGPIVHGVEGSTTYPEQLFRRFIVITDGRNVLVAVAVDLISTHHHMSFAMWNNRLQHLTERLPSFDDRFANTGCVGK